MTVTTHHYVDDVLLEELLYFLATSHHVEETDAGLDRPLYLRNKLYDKTLKSHNYYSNILWFPVPWRSALWLYSTSWLDQNCHEGVISIVTVRVL